MIHLSGHTGDCWEEEPFVARICTNRHLPFVLRPSEVFLLNREQAVPDGYRCYLVSPEIRIAACDGRLRGRAMALPASLTYITDGDIVRVNPRKGEVSVLYRRESRANSLFVTQRCNSKCIMCSQPPRNRSDGHLFSDCLEAIRLMDRRTTQLGITGGEPSLLGEDLVEIIRTCKSFLPETAIDLLSNGRLFSYLSFCEAIGEVDHPRLTVCVPLYSDLPSQHDFIVQARGAFDQTVRGIMNLRRCGLAIEVRVVIHGLNVERLHALTQFVARNLTYVRHVALMGLEMMGFAKAHREVLWVDPVDYSADLRSAVEELDRARIPVSIYNHQLCTLDRELWPYARSSISDWKREYLDLCRTCCVRDRCGGFFASGTRHISRGIRVIQTGECVDPSLSAKSAKL